MRDSDLAVIGPGDKCSAKERILGRLEVQEAQVIVRTSGAEEFLEKGLTIAALAELFPIESDLIPEVEDTSRSNSSEAENAR